MNNNDFYEVDGCIDFIPVTINETYADSVAVTVDNYMRGYGLVVKEVYRFPKGHEPQKPVIPKFVAEWLKEEQHAHTLLKVLNSAEYQRGIYPSTMNDWILDNQYDFIKAWLDGYEIEKEKLYTVEIPNPHSYIDNHSRLARNYKGKVVLEVQDWLNTFESYKLTESEIKQDFDWAWQFAKEVGNDTEV